MVDANGVLLDIPPDAAGDPQYSFPVVTGIDARDPLSIRAARMKIYSAFTSDLDSAGGHISQGLSEVDLSNPEDVKAIPEGAAAVLVHFGESDFLARYQKFEQHLPEWRAQYPKLASVDMRYERQVVLEMQPGASTAAAGASSTPVAAKPAGASGASGARAAVAPGAKPAVAPAWKPGSKPSARPVAGRAVAAKSAYAAHAADKRAAAKPAVSGSEDWHMVVVKPHTKAGAPGRAGNGARPAQPSQTSNSPQAARQ
jgi:cell division protein FtsQ